MSSFYILPTGLLYFPQEEMLYHVRLPSITMSLSALFNDITGNRLARRKMISN